MGMAETFSLQERKKFSRVAICSTWFGCVSEQVINSNSLIIIYLVALGGNASFSMFSTSMGAITAMLTMIPISVLVSKIGLRKSYSLACISDCLAFLLMAAAPFIAGAYAKYVVIFGCMLFSLMSIFYSVAWFPMLDNFLQPQDRGGFFGKMRFSYMLFNTVLIFCFGKLLGEDPPLWMMQLIIVFAGLMMLGRKVCMDKMPVDENNSKKESGLNLKQAFGISISNAPLVGFSFYMCVCNIAIMPLLPLSILYMKTVLDFGASTIMIITSLYLGGQIVGYALLGKAMHAWGTRKFQFITHTVFVLIMIGYCMIAPDNQHAHIWLGVLSFANGLAWSFLYCLSSTENLALARPGNKVMAVAFCNTFLHIGTTCGRIGSTLIMAAGILMPQWECFGVTLSSYNFLFMVSLVIFVFCYLLLLLCPSVVPKHHDYYNPTI